MPTPKENSEKPETHSFKIRNGKINEGIEKSIEPRFCKNKFSGLGNPHSKKLLFTIRHAPVREKNIVHNNMFGMRAAQAIEKTDMCFH